MGNFFLQFIRYNKSVTIKLIVCVIFLLVFTTQSSAQNSNNVNLVYITTSFEQATLNEVINKIESLTDFKFVYQSELITKMNDKVSLTLINKKRTVGEILVEIAKQANISFKQVSKNINIKEAKPDNKSQNIKAIQQIKISGKVLDKNGVLLPGVNIIEIGTMNGVSTDFNGLYNIDASSKGKLKFTYLGYESQTISVENRVEINVLMHPSSQVLSEIVITGYQTLTSERTTGSYGSIKEIQIQNQVEENLMARLSGLTSGLVVDKTADGSDKIIIRGQSTFSSNAEPLIVVDGFPIEGGMESIEPNDVKSISVLKDASAASIWGTRASNGVIVIETKSAQKIEGKSQVTVNFSTTIGDMYDLSDLQLANANDLVNFEWYANLKGAIKPTDLSRNHFAISPVTQLLIDNPPNIIEQLDALKQLDHSSQIEDNLMRKSLLYQASVFVQASSEQNVFSVSLNAKSAESNMVGTGNKKFNISLKNDFSIAKNLIFNIGINVNYRKNESNGISSGSISGRKPYELLQGDNGELLPQSYTWHQAYIDPFHNEKGYLNWNYNLINEVHNKDVNSRALTTRLNASLKYEPITGLELTASFFLEDENIKSRNLASEDVYSTVNMINRYTIIDENTGELNLQFPRGSILREAINPKNSYTVRGLANYRKAFLDNDLRMNVLAGYEISEYSKSSTSNVYAGYNDQSLQYSDLTYTGSGYDSNGNLIALRNQFLTGLVDQFYGPAQSNFPSNSFRNNSLWRKDRHVYYFGNFNFTYKNKYTLTGSARVDKASLFGVEERYKNNPLWSVGGKWNVGQEEFKPDIFDRLELRASYGFTGNINKDFASYATARFQRNTLTQVEYLKLITPKNDDLSFEKTSTFNIGVDFALKNNIIGGSLEYFTKNSRDLLGSFPTDPTSGWSSINSNYANMTNAGIEVELNSIIIKTDDITWSAGINFSKIKNEVTNVVNQLTGSRYYLNGGSGGASEGFPFSAMHNYQYVGINQYGNYQYKGADGNILEGADAAAFLFEDLVYSGQTSPKYYGGFNTTASYKDFSLDVLVTYKGGYVSRKPMINYTTAIYTGNTHESIANIWTEPGDELKESVLPGIYDSQADGLYTTNILWDDLIFRNDNHFFDASHVRFKNVRISYTTPFGGKNQFNLQVYALAQNIAVITKNKLGIDPDYINPYSGQLRFTNPRSYAIGFSLKL